MEDKYYLKKSVILEPLVNQWYAWPMLIAPHTHAMIMTNLHLKILESYIRNPAIHANAVKNPKMLGGPFLDLDRSEVQLVKNLLEKTQKENEEKIAFAESIKTLNAMLLKQAEGYSLEGFYQEAPQELKGYVELVYDLNNHPSIRLIERLLFKSPYYREGDQSIILIDFDKDDRPFVLSTPRFLEHHPLHYQIPFRSESLDRLFKMRDTPQSLEEVADFMPEAPEHQELFKSMFTKTPPNHMGRDRHLLGDKVRIRYFGHAVLLIETKDVSILTDPLISYPITDQSVPRYTLEDLPEKIDYVLLTHNHQDHIMFETLIQIRHKIGTIIVPPSNCTLQDPSVKLILEMTGFSNIQEIDDLETINIPGGSVTGVPFFGEHADLAIRAKSGYLIELHGKKIMCAADSNNIAPELFDHMRKLYGAVDYMFLGMECQGAPMSWLYGPLLSIPLERKKDQSRRFDGSDAMKGLEMIESMDAKNVYVYAMGQEPWCCFISSLKYTSESKPIVESGKLVATCIERGRPAELLFGKKEILID